MDLRHVRRLLHLERTAPNWGFNLIQVQFKKKLTQFVVQHLHASDLYKLKYQSTVILNPVPDVAARQSRFRWSGSSLRSRILKSGHWKE